jgi:O-antigen/teichoic acid export membrane protein
MTNAIPKLWIAELVSRILTASATIYVARTIGVEGYGLIGFVAAVLAYLLEFVRFGTDPVIIRELSRQEGSDEGEKSQVRATAIIVRATLSVPAIAVLAFMAVVSHSATLQSLYLASVIMLFGSIVPVDLFLQAEEKFAAFAGYRIVSNVLNLILILLFVRSPSTSWVVPAAGGAGVLIGEVLFFHTMRGDVMFPGIDRLRELSKYLLGQALPLFGSMVLLLLAGQLSIILVRLFCPVEELGCYVAGYKIYDVGNALLVPTATVLFPKLSSIWSHPDSSQRTSLVANGMSVTVSISLLLFGAALLGGNAIIPFLFGSGFASTPLYVSILAVALFFKSISMLLANSLVAAGRQRAHLFITALFALISVLLGLGLIRWIGATGGAIAISVAFGCEVVALLIVVRKSISLRRIRSVVGRATGLWIVAFIPLYALSAYVLKGYDGTPAVAAGIIIVFSGLFLLLLGRFRVVSLSLVRQNLFDF